jgi:hypothetical protein
VPSPTPAPTWRHRTPTDESELLELLAEKARQGNVAAIRVLLVREEERDRDPRARSLALLQEMAEARRQ